MTGVLLGWSPLALGYSTTASVVIDFGGHGNGTPIAGSAAASMPQSALSDISWVSNGPNSLGVMSNTTYFTELGGYNGVDFYNADFATDQCAAIPGVISVRKYGCRYAGTAGNVLFAATPVTDDGPVGRAGGTLAVTDTTLTGTLNLLASTDEPTGAVADVISPNGAALSLSPGNGTTGYNYRSADGSPFGNVWQGTTTAGTLQVNLTGTFTATSWNITGGTVLFTDPGFLCQQGGVGSIGDALAGTLCTSFIYAGVHQHNGAHLSWGWDTNGRTGGSQASEIEVRDATGQVLYATLSGVLASLSIDGSGNITTNAGEFRRASDPSTQGCGTAIRWNGTQVTCGALTVGKLAITGSVSVVPLPAGIWLLGSSVGILGLLRRRAHPLSHPPAIVPPASRRS